MGVLQDVHKKDRTDPACIVRLTARRSKRYIVQRDAELRHARSDGMVHGGICNGMRWYAMLYSGMWW